MLAGDTIEHRSSLMHRFLLAFFDYCDARVAAVPSNAWAEEIRPSYGSARTPKITHHLGSQGGHNRSASHDHVQSGGP
jgi:hypothetical protein